MKYLSIAGHLLVEPQCILNLTNQIVDYLSHVLANWSNWDFRLILLFLNAVLGPHLD